MIADREEWTMLEIQEEMPLSDTWLRSMEDAGFLKLESPRVRGQVKRLFTQQDIFKVFWLASLRILGFGPRYLINYKKTLNNFKKIVRSHVKKDYNTSENQLFLFGAEDLFPDSDPDNITWDKISPLDKFRLSDELSKLYKEAARLQLMAKKTCQHLKKVETKMELFMNQIEQVANNVPYIEIHKTFKKSRAQIPGKKV